MRGGALGLRGIWGFPLTPFDEDGALDPAALAENVDLQVRGGVDVVVAAGTIAEPESLAANELTAVVATVARAVRGRVPLVAAVPGRLPEAVEAASAAAAVGARALLVLPPAAGKGALPSHLEQLARVSGLELVLYQRGDLLLEPDELVQLANNGALVGVKDGQRDLRRFRRLRDPLAGELLFAAAWEDLTLPYWVLGADAFAPASTAHDPWYARAWHECLAGHDIEQARELLAAFAYPFTDLRLSRPGIEVAAVKYAMCLRGLAGGAVRPPGSELNERERSRIRELVRALDRVCEQW